VSHSRSHRGGVLVGLSVAVCAFLLCPPRIEAQVSLVEDINPGPGGTYIFRAGALGSAIYFNAYDGVHGEELWVSDGTAEGTYLVADIWPEENYDETEAYSSNSQQFLAGSTGMYFMAAHREEPLNPPIHDINLWLSNGHQEPEGFTSIVSGFELALVNSLENAVIMGGDLFIAGWDETYGIELWKVTDTTATRLTDIEPDEGGCFPNYLTVVGNQLFFQATNSATSGIELWVTDGTAGGEMLIDIVGGVWSSHPTDLVAFNGRVFFQASTVDEGAELWSSDGSESGTAMVADIAIGYNVSSDPMNLVPAGDQLFFIASEDGTSNYDLWVYDGAEVRKVKAEGTPSILESVAFDGKLFFKANDPEAGNELWVSDGTDVGTHLVKDIYPGTHTVGEDTFPYSSEPTELTMGGDFLFFNADDGAHGPSLWVTDGTEAGTFMVANLFDYPTEEGPKGLTATTDRLFFQTESDLGREVHSLLTANVVKPPDASTGEESGSTETAYTYSTTGGSVSLDGEPVQYHFNWGDGETSGWLDVGVTSAEHTWAEAGTYDVTVDARSTVMTSITSNHSAPLSVLMSLTETVDVSFDSAPETGEIWVEYEFAVTGSSDYGHDLEYQVNWGDGETSQWAAFNSETGETLSHDWDALGDYEVIVSIRCAEHTTETTNTASHWISIVEETIATPTIDGPSTGWVDTEYSFTIGGESSAGHNLEYLIYWSDGDTGWQPFGAGETSTTVSHTWTAAGSPTIEVHVRCVDHPADHENWAETAIEINEPPSEELTGPDLEGDWDGYPDVSLDFTLTASSNLGHDLQYKVTWDDGGEIDWTDFDHGETSAQLSHTWTDQVGDDTEYFVDVWVRCKQDPEPEYWGQWSVFIHPEARADQSLVGPTSGVAGTSYDYTLTAHSESGHQMQYQIYWGHGDGPGPDDWFDLDPVTGSTQLAHSWPIDGQDHDYGVEYGVRCKDHPNAFQEWDSISVVIPGETITDHTLVGPTEGLVGVDYDFTVTGTSPDEHTLEYKFEWGDGFPTNFETLDGGTATVSYHWAYPGEFTVRSSVRCTTHNNVLSEKEQLVTITSDTPPDLIFADGFESGTTSAW
jgi:ELWxxDGT repeat protein